MAASRFAEQMVVLPEPDQVAVQLPDFRVALAFGEVEFALSEGALIFRIRQQSGGFGGGDARELLEEFGSPLGNEFREFRIMVGKIEERARSGEFLPLKQHRGVRPKQ